MHGYLIDPIACTVTVAPWDGNYQTIYERIGVDCFDAVLLDAGDTIFVDDEGLMKEPQYFFRVDDSTPLAGKGFVLGTDDEGDSISPRITLDQLKARVTFYQLVCGLLFLREAA
jgi:hypothetical protein